MHPEPRCLLPNSVLDSDGVGPLVKLREECGRLLVVTLSIDDAIDRHLLTVSLWGSPDGEKFQPLARLRPRQYCGIHSTLLNLAGQPQIAFLRVQWTIERQRKCNHLPSFQCQVFVEQSGARLAPAASLRSFTQSVGAPKWSRTHSHAA